MSRRANHQRRQTIADRLESLSLHIAAASLAAQLALQLGEAHGAEVQRLGVERLQLETAAQAPFRRLPHLQPLALAHLVADRLRRPAQVAYHLAGHKLM